MTNNGYVVITPVQNEERHIESTLRSMIHQHMKPTQWIIVDDGSADQTAAMVKRYQQTYDWITLVRRTKHKYHPGKGII